MNKNGYAIPYAVVQSNYNCEGDSGDQIECDIFLSYECV